MKKKVITTNVKSFQNIDLQLRINGWQLISYITVGNKVTACYVK